MTAGDDTNRKTPDDICVSQLLADVLLISEEMLRLGREDEWDAVAELESKRSCFLKQCFDSPISENKFDAFSQALAVMLHLNEELIAVLEKAKGQVAIQRTDTRKKASSVKHYLDVEIGH